MIKTTIIITFALFSLSCIQHPQFSSSEPKSSCKLTLEQAPTIRGLKLGMNLSEIKSHIPSIKEISFQDEHGITQIGKEPSKSFPSWGENFGLKGIHSIYLELIDGKLTFIRIVYQESDAWINGEKEFASKVSEQLGLPDQWENGDARYDFINGYKTLRCKCQDFNIASYIVTDNIFDEKQNYEIVKSHARFPTIEISNIQALEKIDEHVKGKEKHELDKKQEEQERKRQKIKL